MERLSIGRFFLVTVSFVAHNKGMGKVLNEDRQFIPGSTGWTVEDLDDPEIERLWETNSYEIVEGVLASIPPALLDGDAALYKLMSLVERHLTRQGIENVWGSGTDFVVASPRVAKPDAVLMLREDLARQQRINAKVSKRKTKYGRIRVAPALIIESVSMGHEKHDRATKRRWYAEFGVKNYWILDAYRKTLECLILDGESYRLDVMGRKSERIRPSAFAGLLIPLAKIWV